MISYYLLYHMFDFKLYYLLYPYQDNVFITVTPIRHLSLSLRCEVLLHRSSMSRTGLFKNYIRFYTIFTSRHQCSKNSINHPNFANKIWPTIIGDVSTTVYSVRSRPLEQMSYLPFSLPQPTGLPSNWDRASYTRIVVLALISKFIAVFI